MDHSKHTSLSFAELGAASLGGVPILDAEDRELGKVSHVHGDGADSGIVVDLGDRVVSIPSNEIDFMRDANEKIHGVLKWTRDQVEAMPEHRHN